MIRTVYAAIIGRRLDKGKTISRIEKILMRKVGLKFPNADTAIQEIKPPLHTEKPDYTLCPAVFRMEPRGKVLMVPLEFTEGPPPRKVTTHGDMLRV